MEVVGLLRGYWRALFEWVQDASMIHIPYKYTDPKTKKKDVGYARVAIRPMIPIEIVFPKQGLNTLLGIVASGGNKDIKRDKNKVAFEMYRKMLGLKKLPKDWKEYKHVITNILKQHAVRFHPIGIKEDDSDDEGNELL